MSLTYLYDARPGGAALRALDRERFVQPTPIQASRHSAPARGRDLLGVAQTGTGKTAAFALPMLQHLAADPRDPTVTAHAPSSWHRLANWRCRSKRSSTASAIR